MATIVFTLVWGAASTLVAIFECRPIPYYWVWDGSPGGSCMDKNNVQLANAVISIALDVCILVIPLWNIQNRFKFYAGQCDAKPGPHSGVLSSSYGSAGARRWFWTTALASTHPDNEDDGRPTNRDQTESSEAKLGGPDGINIIFTTTYEVDYESAPPEPCENDIMMDNLHGRMVLTGQNLPSKSYQATAGYGE
ncbi:hypothetical protein VMCG_00582 [Cytospora schulzeri]|uniref:Rhodopsin domain-containing protein n=1 Tax=Cytospora schulzeri TaxID=448051 RepID=A0A423X9D1_9PEZI|nr:hypothetical protein VMCG_00582 [Valsa malicola]